MYDRPSLSVIRYLHYAFLQGNTQSSTTHVVLFQYFRNEDLDLTGLSLESGW